MLNFENTHRGTIFKTLLKLQTAGTPMGTTLNFKECIFDIFFNFQLSRVEVAYIIRHIGATYVAWDHYFPQGTFQILSLENDWKILFEMFWRKLESYCRRATRVWFIYSRNFLENIIAATLPLYLFRTSPPRNDPFMKSVTETSRIMI